MKTVILRHVALFEHDFPANCSLWYKAYTLVNQHSNGTWTLWRCISAIPASYVCLPEGNDLFLPCQIPSLRGGIGLLAFVAIRQQLAATSRGGPGWVGTATSKVGQTTYPHGKEKGCTWYMHLGWMVLRQVTVGGLKKRKRVGCVWCIVCFCLGGAGEGNWRTGLVKWMDSWWCHWH